MAGRYPLPPFWLFWICPWVGEAFSALQSTLSWGTPIHLRDTSLERRFIYFFIFFFCHSSVILFDCLQGWQFSSLRKHPTFGEASTGFPANWRLRNVCRNSKPLLIGRGREISFNQSGVLRDASSVWNFCANFSGVISRETSCGVTKCQLFSRANKNPRWAL